MAARLDAALPEAGGLMRLHQLRCEFFAKRADIAEKVGDTHFHPIEIEHLRKAFENLGDDDLAKSTLMSIIAFAQMKNDCT